VLPTTAKVLIAALALYLAAGLLFALAFVVRGVKRIDPDARGATWGFRLAILPGVAALWPFLLRRRAVGDDPEPRERTPHRAAARARSNEVAP
jgi:hypothetical protein